MNNEAWYIDTHTQVVIENLRNSVTAEYINEGTVTGQLQTVAGVTVGDPITFAYVTDSNGKWVGEIPSSIDFTVGLTYIMEITITVSGKQQVIRLIREAQYYVQ